MPKNALPVDQYIAEAEGLKYDDKPWIDWYHEIIFQHEGEWCSLLTYMMQHTDPPMPDAASNQVTFTRGKIRLEKKVNQALENGYGALYTPSKYKEIPQGEVPEFLPFMEEMKSNPFRFTPKDIVYDHLEDGSLRVALGPADDGQEYIYKSDGTKIIRGKTKDFETEYVLKKVCPTIWWGNKENYDMPWSKDGTMAIRGSEELCSAEGYVIIKGERIPIKNGVAISEHVWIQNMAWMDFRYLNWVWFHADNVKGLISHHVMKDKFVGSWGSIYLPGDDKFLHCKSIKFRQLDHAWYPEYMRYVPIKTSAYVVTDEGVLNMEMKAIDRPSYRISVQDFEYVAEDLQAWTFNLWTLMHEIEGTFTYNDGRVIDFKGVGMNEPQVVSPIC